MIPTQQQSDWRIVTNYLSKECTDIVKRLCYGCPIHKLYDKNNKSYKVTRLNTLDEVKTVVEAIRKINNEAVIDIAKENEKSVNDWQTKLFEQRINKSE